MRVDHTGKTHLFGDVQVVSDISCDPDIVYPEEPGKLDLLDGAHDGCGCVGVRNVEPATAVIRKDIRVRGRDLIIGNSPLGGVSHYRGVLDKRTEDKSASLEVWCFSKLSSEYEQLKMVKLRWSVSKFFLYSKWSKGRGRVQKVC